MATLEKITKKLLTKEPFYGLLLLNLNKVETKSLSTLAVGLQGMQYTLYINPEYWDSLTDEQQIAGIRHELMHVVFKHCTSLYDFPNHEISNIACDLEINQYIKNLPEGCIFLSKMQKQFPTANLLEKEGSRSYYHKIMAAINNDDASSPGFAPSKENGMGSHDPWETIGNLSEEEKEIINEQTDYIIKNVAEQVEKSCGKIPGEFRSIIEKLKKPTKQAFNWKAYFRRLLGSSEEYTKKSTRKRQSKRYVDAPGFKHLHKQRLLVAIDTSGSVSDKELAEFFAEINHIHKAQAIIDIIEFDCKVTRNYTYNGKFDGKVTGRGGTCFDAAIKYYNERYKQYDAFVVFTDGYDIVSVKPFGKSIWLITSNGKAHDSIPGYIVKIPKSEG